MKAALLCFYIGKQVKTPKGNGELKQVLDARHIRVALNRDPKVMKTFHENQVEPYIRPEAKS